ncbi:MAG: hypothetical protein IKY78_05105 [Clostridia bacterium]|nr:hypothetical protein [Clostridia bacterium]
MKNSFVLYYDLGEVFSFLTDEEAGQLIKAVFAFETQGEVTEFSDRMMQSSYKRITDSLLRNREKYELMRAERRKAAHKKWEKEREMS